MLLIQLHSDFGEVKVQRIPQTNKGIQTSSDLLSSCKPRISSRLLVTQEVFEILIMLQSFYSFRRRVRWLRKFWSHSIPETLQKRDCFRQWSRRRRDRWSGRGSEGVVSSNSVPGEIERILSLFSVFWLSSLSCRVSRQDAWGRSLERQRIRLTFCQSPVQKVSVIILHFTTHLMDRNQLILTDSPLLSSSYEHFEGQRY